MTAITTIYPGELVRLPARRGVAIRLKRGQTIKLINTHGQQVVDTWAFNPDDLSEAMSMEHSRPFWLKLNPRQGDSLVTNKRRKILTLIEDTSPGIHDQCCAMVGMCVGEPLGSRWSQACFILAHTSSGLSRAWAGVRLTPENSVSS